MHTYKQPFLSSLSFMSKFVKHISLSTFPYSQPLLSSLASLLITPSKQLFLSLQWPSDFNSLLKNFLIAFKKIPPFEYELLLVSRVYQSPLFLHISSNTFSVFSAMNQLLNIVVARGHKDTFLWWDTSRTHKVISLLPSKGHSWRFSNLQGSSTFLLSYPLPAQVSTVLFFDYLSSQQSTREKNL